jgi:hypothetical protein
VGEWFGGGGRLVEAFKEVVLAPWSSQTITRRNAIPNTEARDSIDPSVKAQVLQTHAVPMRGCPSYPDVASQLKQ